MRLIDRRIGLLFAGFLLCFLVIVGRAFWLQGVQGAQLASEAVSQQTETITVPGTARQPARPPRQPARHLRRRGDDLRDSLPGEKPAAGGRQAGPILGEKKGEVLEALTEESGFSYIAQKVDLGTAAKVEALRTGRDRPAARQPPLLPAG